MQRFGRVLVLALVAGLAGMFIGQPDVVRAIAGLTGRTHLVVKERNLKVLRGVFTAVVSSNNHSTDLYEWDRAGTQSAEPYRVPDGRVFIMTDVGGKIQGQQCCFDDNVRHVTIRIANGPAAGGAYRGIDVGDDFTSNVSTLGGIRIEHHFTSGVAFEPQTQVALDVGISNAATSPMTGSWDGEFWVMGYETEAE